MCFNLKLIFFGKISDFDNKSILGHSKVIKQDVGEEYRLL